jgi:group II intron reverse transcriptase/maturase
MNILKRLEVVNSLSKKNPNWIHRDLFRLLHDDEIWTLAYQNTKRNKGSLTPGVDGLTYNDVDIESIQKVKEKVVKEKYLFQPVRQIFIPKGNGKLRPLGIPSANDRIVQEVIRMILEAIYEPIFDKDSYGFRPKRGCHHALQHVEKVFRWVDWIIEGDIKSAYPSINHQILSNFLEKRIGDFRFMNLIRKSLKCGIQDGKLLTHSSLGIPQGSIVSPILSNIYYHEMDLWVREKAVEINQPGSSLKSVQYKKVEHTISKYTHELEEIPHKSKEYKETVKLLKAERKRRSTFPSLKQSSIEIHYVRYADDWMLGIKGKREIAVKLKEEIAIFLKSTLKQELHSEKTKITNIRQGKATFLGYDIYLPQKKQLAVYTNHGTRTLRRSNPMLRFDLPLERVLNRMIERGYIKRTHKGIRPISKQNYTSLEDKVIVAHFRSVWLGMSNYYAGCTNVQKLQYIHYLLKFSCAMTLAHRHRSSISKIFAKYSKTLRVEIKAKIPKWIEFPDRTSWSIKERKWLINTPIYDPFNLFANQVSRSARGRFCQICGETHKVEMHHIKHVRKGGTREGLFAQDTALLFRKQIPVCRTCHLTIHRGEYDGPSLGSMEQIL